MLLFRTNLLIIVSLFMRLIRLPISTLYLSLIAFRHLFEYMNTFHINFILTNKILSNINMSYEILFFSIWYPWWWEIVKFSNIWPPPLNPWQICCVEKWWTFVIFHKKKRIYEIVQGCTKIYSKSNKINIWVLLICYKSLLHDISIGILVHPQSPFLFEGNF
jgi:hypothetical protein